MGSYPADKWWVIVESPDPKRLGLELSERRDARPDERIVDRDAISTMPHEGQNRSRE